MKCIRCNTDNKLKDRTANNNRCVNCGHPFVFEPTKMDFKAKFTDGFFQKVINDISVNNTVFFIPKQLAYFIDKSLKRKTESSLFCYIFFIFFISSILSVFPSILLQNFPISFTLSLFILLTILIFHKSWNRPQYMYFKQHKKAILSLIITSALALIIGLILSITVIKSFWVFSLVTILGMLYIFLGIKKFKKAPFVSQLLLVTPSQAESYLNDWQRINGNIDKKLPLPSETQNSESNPNINPEINAYSFDRLIVCDSAEIAQFLIANNFHFENNCAILSVNRYPENIFDTVLNMLKNNPNLIVYTLHDASPQGLRLINHLRTSENWFANQNVTIYDLGILPRQIIKNPNFFINNSEESAEATKRLLPEISHQLTAEEIEWLQAGNYVELECFSPQKLLQIILKGIAISRLPEGENNQNINILDVDNNYTGSMMIYSVDSFG